MTAPEPIHDLARGDLGVSRQLTRALRVLMDSTADAQLKKQLRDIVEGKAGARDLMRNEAFDRVLDRTLPAALRRFAEMPEEERQRLAEQGDAEAERLRSAPLAQQPPVPAEQARPRTGFVVPGTRKPDRERVVTPEEDDEDDAYFRARQQRGWLE